MAAYPTGVTTQATVVWGGDGTTAVDVPVTAAGTDMMNASDAAAQRALLGLGSAAVADTGDFDAAGSAAAAQAAAEAASDPVGSAAAVLSTSLQQSNNLSDVSDKYAALAELGVDKYTSGPDNAFNITNDARLVWIDSALTANRVYTLPTLASMNLGHGIIVADPEGRLGTYTLTIDGNGAEVINGAANIVMTQQYDAVQFWPSPSGWAATPVKLSLAARKTELSLPTTANVYCINFSVKNSEAFGNNIQNIFASVPAEFAGTLVSIIGLATMSGSITLAVQINGVSVTSLSALAVTTTPQTVAANGGTPVTVATGDSLRISCSGASSDLGLKFTLKLTRA